MIRTRSAQMPQLRDMTILGGWLFADLLLCLVVIFLVAVPPAPKPAYPPPVLNASVTTLKPGDPYCIGDIQPICKIQITETQNSHGNIQWNAKSDMDKVAFSPTSGILTPGNSGTITISAIPCQNGSFTFSGQEGQSVMPVTILWRCTPKIERLSLTSFGIDFTINNIQGLINNDQNAINDVKQQIKNTPGLAGHSVGFAIVSTGALTINDIMQAQMIDDKIDAIMANLGEQNFVFKKASYYNKRIYNLGLPDDEVHIDTYFYVTE